MAHLEILKPTAAEAEELIEKISIEDKREILAQGVSVRWGVLHTLETSHEAVAFRINGDLACITGLSSTGILIETFYPWLLGTEMMQKHPRLVLKYSKEILARWREKHPYLVNYVDARHHRAISWLTHLGATFEYIPQHGAFRRPFYKFSFGEEVCV